MDENDNRMNIDTPSLSDHKRKLDRSAEESLFPCKKVLVSAPTNAGSSEAPVPTNISVPQVKLTKEEREMLKLKKSEERERDRLKKEQERQRRDEEKLRRDEERQKKVLYSFGRH